MARQGDNLTAIEIGTSHIKTAMARVRNDGELDLLGYEEISSQDNVRKGEIVNINITLDMLSDTLNRLEQSTGKTVGSVYLSVTGGHIGSTNASGSVPVTAPDRSITEQDIIVATKNAREWNLPMNQVLIHSYQRTYVIDGVHKVSSPMGMTGNQLSADIHMIYGDHNRIETLLKLLIHVLGEPVQDIIFGGIASFYGIDHRETAHQGVLVIDIGAGVTEYVLFYDDGCMHSGQISVGTDHLANDLALALQLPLSLSRELIKEYGSAVFRSDVALSEVAIPNGQKTKKVPEATIHKVIEMRLQEIFEIIRDELDEQDLRGLMGDGVILVGGGALIENIDELAENVFKTPARIGMPRKLENMDPEFFTPEMLTPIGLLCVGQQLQQMDMMNSPPLRKIVKDEVRTLIEICKRAIKF